MAVYANATFVANVANGSFTATTFVGALSGLASSATIAASANAVAGANVSGAVSFATTANAVAGGNVSGAVSFATTANAVAGGNVSGQVANALISGTVYTAAQPNITSVGTLTGLSVKSNIAYISPNAANTITSSMLNGGTLSFSGTSGQLFSITDSMTGTIFSVNDVSGIPLITVQDTGIIGLGQMGGYVVYGVNAAVTAAGSTQGTATALTKQMNVVTTVSAGQGVMLPPPTAGMVIYVTNASATSLLVYPTSGGIIGNLSTNAGYTMPAGSTLQYLAPTTAKWFLVGAVYA